MRVKYLSVKQQKKLEGFPSFDASGSVKGMKKKFYGKDALLVRCGSYIYHVGNLWDHNDSQYLSRGETIYYHDAH